MDKPNQRKGSESNSQVGRDFENKTRVFFQAYGIQLEQGISLDIGINSKKPHKFDLVDERAKVIVECKSHKWTEGNNVPSAKITVWNEAMYYFYSAPKNYRKIFFVLKDFSVKKQETLAQYYIRTYKHLIPSDVEIWEYDEIRRKAEQLL